MTAAKWRRHMFSFPRRVFARVMFATLLVSVPSSAFPRIKSGVRRGDSFGPCRTFGPPRLLAKGWRALVECQPGSPLKGALRAPAAAILGLLSALGVVGRRDALSCLSSTGDRRTGLAWLPPALAPGR